MPDEAAFEKSDWRCADQQTRIQYLRSPIFKHKTAIDYVFRKESVGHINHLRTCLHFVYSFSVASDPLKMRHPLQLIEGQVAAAVGTRRKLRRQTPVCAGASASLSGLLVFC